MKIDLGFVFWSCLILAFMGFLLYLYLTDEPATGASPANANADGTPQTAPGVQASSWKKLGNGACRTSDNEYSTVMYSHRPPNFVSTLNNCKTACESNAAQSVKTEICTGISFFKLDQSNTNPVGKCSQVARSPWLSPNVNTDTEECWYYGKGEPNGAAQLRITADRF
jgi:hypothetical protein